MAAEKGCEIARALGNQHNKDTSGLSVSLLAGSSLFLNKVDKELTKRVKFRTRMPKSMYDQRAKLGPGKRKLYDTLDLGCERCREFLFEWQDLVTATADLLNDPSYSNLREAVLGMCMCVHT